MKTFLSLLLIIQIIPFTKIFSQVAINNTGDLPEASAMLDVQSSDKGILIPRMTNEEIRAINKPSNGLMVFSISDQKMYIYVEVENSFKELLYGPEALLLPSEYTIGSGGTCSNTIVNGIYHTNLVLDITNYVVIDVNVLSVGTYNLSTNTVNGYHFIASGSFSSTGTQQITLFGNGIPVTEQTDTFILNSNDGGGSCSFDIDVCSEFMCGLPFTDTRDGQSYNTVLIGSQCWMAENLSIGMIINGDVDQTSYNQEIEKYCYEDYEYYCDIFGGLYQWNEMMQYTTTAGAQGICPENWHIPTDAEWCTLENEVDAGSISCSTTGYRGNDAGDNLKITGGIPYWHNSNTGTNNSGFTALGSGIRRTSYSNRFDNQLLDTYFWTSTESSTAAWHRRLNVFYPEIGRAGADSKNNGFSVRCIRD